eukprot:1522389-Prymnesium_polylepis.1
MICRAVRDCASLRLAALCALRRTHLQSVACSPGSSAVRPTVATSRSAPCQRTSPGRPRSGAMARASTADGGHTADQNR